MAEAEAERSQPSRQQLAAEAPQDSAADDLPEAPRLCATPRLMATASATAADCSALVLGDSKGPATQQSLGGTRPPSSQNTPRVARLAGLAKLRACANGRTGGTSIAASRVAPLLEALATALAVPDTLPVPLAMTPPQPLECPEAIVPQQPCAAAVQDAAAEAVAIQAPQGPDADQVTASRQPSSAAILPEQTEENEVSDVAQQAPAVAEHTEAGSEAEPKPEPPVKQRNSRRWSILSRLRLQTRDEETGASQGPPVHPAAAAMQEAAATHQAASPQERAASPVKPWIHTVLEHFNTGEWCSLP